MSCQLISAKGHAIVCAKGAMHQPHGSPYRKGEEPVLPKVVTNHSSVAL